MELNCKRNRKNSSKKIYWQRSAAGKDSLALHVIYLYKSRASWKQNHLSAEFKALMGKNSNLITF